MTTVLIVLLVLIAVGWGVLTLVVKQKRSGGEAALRAELGGDDRILAFDDKAICRGTESGPFNHLVGMGSLGFNGDELVFQRWSPPAEVRITKDDLISHQFTVEHLGNSFRKPLLQVTYRNPDNAEGETPGEDVVAWEVVDPDAWNAALTG